MKLIKAIKQTGAKRLHRKYKLENYETFEPSCEFEKVGDVFEFKSENEDAFLADIEHFMSDQIERLTVIAREENIVEVEDVIVEQGTKEWLKARAGIISASETPFNSKGLKIPTYYTYVNKKVAQAIRIDLGLSEKESYTNEAMKNGNNLEAGVRAEYEKITGNKIIEKGFIKAKNMMIGASPDGITTDDDFNTINIEIKNVLIHTYLAELHSEYVQKQYKAQVQVQMFI